MTKTIVGLVVGFIIGLVQLVGAQGPEKVGASVCMGCHADQAEVFKKNIHAKTFPAIKKIDFEQSCETCHGAGSQHAEAAGDKTKPGFATIHNPAKLIGAESSQICLQCHESGNRTFWKGSAHEGREVSCAKCHSVHHAKSGKLLAQANPSETCYQCHQLRKMQMMKSSHMPIRESKMNCSDCHNPHGSAGPKLLIQNSVNENCTSCHAEKRGPFLWEHPPVRESCSNCHEAHGSQHNKLLTVKTPRLCQQCHDNSQHPGTAGNTINLDPAKGSVASNRNIGAAKPCIQCHTQFHGSNHPGGVRFIR